MKVVMAEGDVRERVRAHLMIEGRHRPVEEVVTQRIGVTATLQLAEDVRRTSATRPAGRLAHGEKTLQTSTGTYNTRIVPSTAECRMRHFPNFTGETKNCERVFFLINQVKLGIENGVETFKESNELRTFKIATLVTRRDVDRRAVSERCVQGCGREREGVMEGRRWRGGVGRGEDRLCHSLFDKLTIGRMIIQNLMVSMLTLSIDTLISPFLQLMNIA
ncbi:unnamed protein product [Nesidiocoris tenuis]|uniref:Uncharacterized protein n=1 Tax=Nesidiocoris tenuis TaxID=355587 RepID=A0A6H5HHF7_9HEMI|nr:unnamed protein product [Nesidiocoris tenuis]